MTQLEIPYFPVAQNLNYGQVQIFEINLEWLGKVCSAAFYSPRGQALLLSVIMVASDNI